MTQQNIITSQFLKKKSPQNYSRSNKMEQTLSPLNNPQNLVRSFQRKELLVLNMDQASVDQTCKYKLRYKNINQNV